MMLLTRQRYTKTVFSSLPGYLTNIAAAMPKGHPWQDTNTIIFDHTAFPYFTYFHPREKKLNTEKTLTTSGKSNQPIAVGMGLSMYRTPASPRHPRFCCKCMNEQLIDYGYSFFQVQHQLPGVSLCWKHNEILFDGCIHCGPYPLIGKKLTMPGQCLCSSFKARPILIDIIGDEAKWIAENSTYILSSKSCGDNQTEKLRIGIIQSGFCKGTLVDYSKLADAIETRFNHKFLTSIGYPAWENDKPSPWLRRYFNHGKSNRQLSTVSGILIMGAAFKNVKDFENGSVIKQIKSQSISINLGDEQPESWKKSLTQTLKDHDFRISSCANTLIKTPWVISKEAFKQNITVPLSPNAIERIGNKNLQQIITKLKNGTYKKQILNDYKISEWTLTLIELSVPNIRKINKKKAKDLILLKHRKTVKDFLQRAPSSTRNDVIQQLPRTYDYLINNDKTWFQDFVPKATKKASKKRANRLNWQEIDNKLAVKIKETVKRVLNNGKKPLRITASYLLSQHGQLQRYSSNQSKLPNTSKTLNEVTESKEQYFFRKVTWGIKQLNQAEQEISIDNLRRTCGISQYRLQPHLSEIRNLIYSLGGKISSKSILFE